MKYLFFFNGQLLLLCCVCNKIAIQDFVTWLQKKIRKIYGFIDGYTDGIQPVGISQRVEKKLQDCATFTDGLKHVGISESCKKFTGLCHNHRRNHRQTYAHPEVHACQTRVRLHKYRWIFRRIKKSGGIFELFWCTIQLISDGIECHRQQLMSVGNSVEKIAI
jgi:hypothetical protein